MSLLIFMHAADLHLDSEFGALTRANAEKRRQQQRELLFKLADTCQKHGAQALLLSGDIFENDTPGPETRRDFCRALGALAIPVFICTGNHDPYFSGSVWERLDLPENVHLFKSERFETVSRPDLNARFHGAGFEKSFCPPLLRGYTAPAKIDGVFDIMLLHGDLNPSDYCPVTRAEIGKTGMDYIALGHVHTRAPIDYAGDTAFAYPGCPEGRGYDETGEKGAYLVTLTEFGTSAQFIPLGGVRYEVLNVNVSGADPLEAINQATEELSSRDFCRIILTGKADAAIDLTALRRALDGRFAELQLRDETAIRRDTWAQTGTDTLAGLFLEKLKGLSDTAANERERKKIELAAAYGVAALEGRDVLQ